MSVIVVYQIFYLRSYNLCDVEEKNRPKEKKVMKLETNFLLASTKNEVHLQNKTSIVG